MPSVNVRLTDEQHAELVEAGKRENRSLQREMIYRMFGRFNHVSADSQVRDAQARTIVPPAVDDHFRPDPKPERKKK